MKETLHNSPMKGKLNEFTLGPEKSTLAKESGRPSLELEPAAQVSVGIKQNLDEQSPLIKAREAKIKIHDGPSADLSMESLQKTYVRNSKHEPNVDVLNTNQDLQTYESHRIVQIIGDASTGHIQESPEIGVKAKPRLIANKSRYKGFFLRSNKLAQAKRAAAE